MAKPIGLRLDEGLIERIDTARGSTSRTAWITGALESALDADGGTGPLDSVPAGPVVYAPARGSVSSSTAGPSMWMRPTSQEAKRGVKPIDR